MFRFAPSQLVLVALTACVGAHSSGFLKLEVSSKFRNIFPVVSAELKASKTPPTYVYNDAPAELKQQQQEASVRVLAGQAERQAAEQAARLVQEKIQAKAAQAKDVADEKAKKKAWDALGKEGQAAQVESWIKQNQAADKRAAEKAFERQRAVVKANLASEEAALAKRIKDEAKRAADQADARQHLFEGKSTSPCTCVAADAKWKPCTRTVPRCVFIDLGAANGNSFNGFLSDKYGPVAKCPNAQWSAVLVEANPDFNKQLENLAAAKLTSVNTTHIGQVSVMPSTAAYMCEAKTSFFLDGSSLSNRRGYQEKVTVPTTNLNRILTEQTIPGDWVMVKMDIGGSEYDVLPCTAESQAASLIDKLYLEQHDAISSMSATTSAQMEAAKKKLLSRGVDIP